METKNKSHLSNSYLKIRDLRHKEKFVIDDKYLNGYARLCGWKATLVYLSLCRHSSKEQKSFPSIKLMSRELGISEDSVLKGMKSLKEWNVISVKSTFRRDGGRGCNIYTLIDKTQWKLKPTHIANSVIHPLGQDNIPSSQETITPIATNRNKDTHINESQIKVDITSPEKIKIFSLNDLSETEFEEIAQKYNVPTSFVKSKYDDLVNYCEGSGKVYKNYYAILSNWVKVDALKIRRESTRFNNKVNIDARHIPGIQKY